MANVPLHLMAARLRPAPAPAENDEDWDAVIARAKMQTALPKAPRPLPHRDEWAEIADTPPPLSARQAPRTSMARPKAPRTAGSERTQATLDAFIRGTLKKPVVPVLAFVARRPAGQDLATPPPLGTARPPAGSLSGRAKRA